MRALVDAQLPPALCIWLQAKGIEAVHVASVLGGQTADRLIADTVEAEGLVLFTKDDDFALRHPPKRSQLVWLRCGNISNRGLIAWLEPRLAAVMERLVASERFIEVR